MWQIFYYHKDQLKSASYSRKLAEEVYRWLCFERKCLLDQNNNLVACSEKWAGDFNGGC